MIHAKKMIIRTKKEDSAFLYSILEANEGLAAYSTVDYKPHDPIRDVELLYTEESEADILALLKDLSDFVTIIP